MTGRSDKKGVAVSKRKSRKRQQIHIANQERQVASLVREWTQRLGLSDWRVIHGVNPDLDSAARAWLSESYPNVHLQFAPLPDGEHGSSWFKPDAALEESVVHELVHTMMHEVDLSVAATVEQLPKRLQGRATRDYDHHREHFVERMCRALVAIRSGEQGIGRVCDEKSNT